MPNLLINLSNTIRRECFNTPARGARTVCLLASVLALGIAVGVGSSSIVAVTFCMLVALAIVSGVTGSDSPVLGPVCAAAFGLSGYLCLAASSLLPLALVRSLSFHTAVIGGAAAAVWWAMQMALVIRLPFVGGFRARKQDD